MPIRLTLYSRGGCGLCEEAYEVIASVRQQLPETETRLEVVDITTDGDLMARYRYDIPVLAIDGRPSFRHHVDASLLLRCLVDGTPGPLESTGP